MKNLAAALCLLGLAACSQPDAFPTPESPAPPPGSNEMLRAPISSVEGYEVLISDVVIPAGATVPRHFHPGEEFLYVISGSAIHVEEGQPDRELNAGDAYVIPPNAIHAPRGGPAGARAIVFRVHVADQPERVLVDEADSPAD